MKSKVKAIVAAIATGMSLGVWAEAYSGKVESASAGTVSVDCKERGAWRFAERVAKDAAGVETLTVTLEADAEAQPPKFEVAFAVPQHDVHYVWTASNENYSLQPDWATYYSSAIAQWVPVYALMNGNDTSRLTVACDETKRKVVFRCGVREEDCSVRVKFEFFSEPEAPLRRYAVAIRLDPRASFYGDAIGAAVEWMGPSAPVPEAAFDPVYSCWYDFHQDVFDKEVEAEAALAAKYGMKTLIVDDGWQTDDTNRGYAFCGDWQVSKRRFPDMAAHVKRVQAMGVKYMIWYSVPFVGTKSANFARFKGKYLKHFDGLGASVLDPRFPEVREFLASTYETAAKEWGLDGFKLDFIDNFELSGEDPAVKENYRGRDIRSVPEATDVLFTEIARRLNAVKPGMLIEFRQRYIGPAIRKYGNMLRAGDCPGNARANRLRTTALRLTSGTTAVHSDMLVWDPTDTPENAALQILNSLFSTVQYSMMLRKLPETHGKMMRNWIDFTQRHRETLLKGAFRPHHPEAGYPVIEAESAAERIVAVYNDACVADAGAGDRSVVIVNATGADRLTLRLAKAPKSVESYDTFGVRQKPPTLRAGVQDVPVCRSGYLQLSY